MQNSPKTVVLAYSGGLDTTYTAKYLSQEKGMNVISVVANTGGFNAEQLATIETKAKAIGVKEHVVLNIEQEYYNKCLRFLIYGNILKNQTYPLSVSSERFFQAKAIAEFAKQRKVDAIAHGCTVAGNDQVRFDLVFKLLCPGTEIIALVRDEKLKREDEINYLRSHGVEGDFKKMEYSINAGLWGTSVGGKETLTTNLPLPEPAYPSHCEKDGMEQIVLEFEKGQIVAINGKKYTSAVDAIRFLNEIGSKYAIGRGMHVGDTIIGTKGRVGFEAPAANMLIKAHHELEKHTLTKWQLYWKDMLANWYGTMLHDGLYLEPAMRQMELFMEATQEHVTGKVFVQLLPYRFFIEGIESKKDMMRSGFGAYGEEAGNWTADDVKGFINMMANPLKNYYTVNPDEL
jgi:argininosuccinate synthase